MAKAQVVKATVVCDECREATMETVGCYECFHRNTPTVESLHTVMMAGFFGELCAECLSLAMDTRPASEIVAAAPGFYCLPCWETFFLRHVSLSGL